MSNRTFVIGVGMTKFEKPGTKDWDYPDMGREAGQKALADAGISYDQIEQAYVGYCYGDSTTGQRALYELGLTGIPAVNVNNNCSTGSSRPLPGPPGRAVRPGRLRAGAGLREDGEGQPRVELRGPHQPDGQARDGHDRAPRLRPRRRPPPQVFGNAGQEYMEKYGVDAEAFAKIGEKNHRHSVNNPYSQFQDQYSLEDIKNAPMVYDPLTKLQCCPTSDGGGAAIIASERFVDEHDLWGKAVEIAGQAMTTDFENTFDGSDMSIAGFHMTKAAARRPTRSRASARRTCRSSSCTTASAPTSSSPTRASGSARRARPATSSTPAPSPTAASGWSTRRVGSSPRATRSAPPAWPSAPS